MIDGHLRDELVAVVLDWLETHGAIIMDNGQGYSLASLTREHGLRRVEFYGFSPCIARRHCASIAFAGECFLLEPTEPIMFKW